MDCTSGCFGAEAHFHSSLFLPRYFFRKLFCSSLPSALNCILNLLFLSSAQVSVFLSSSHLPIKLFTSAFAVRVWRHVPGLLGVQLSGPDRFLLLGETQFTRKAGSPRQMVRLMFPQGSNSLFQSHQKEDSSTFI